MTDATNEDIGDELKDLAKISGNTSVAPAHGIAAIALSMSMKFHDINTVQDGTLYQQYKLEGKNMSPLHLDMVLDTATRIEQWLLGASERIAKIVVDALALEVTDDDAEEPEAEAPAERQPGTSSASGGTTP